VGDLSPFRWHGLYNPFVVAPGGRRLVTSNGSDIKTTLWLAEF
jgi:hypothetical protein